MEALATSLAVVALSEIGDKTQLLAIVLATRFRKPLPVIAGILAATVANHFFAALVGSEVASILDGPWFRYAVAVSFVAMAVWTLIPDKPDEGAAEAARFGPFLTTAVTFFLVEMGDKTQIATIALGAGFHDVVAVATGTTLGMLLADVPAVLLGHEVLKHVPLKMIRMTISPSYLLQMSAIFHPQGGHCGLRVLASLPQIIACLHGEPRPRGRNASLFQANGQIRADPGLAVQNTREGHTRHG